MKRHFSGGSVDGDQESWALHWGGTDLWWKQADNELKESERRIFRIFPIALTKDVTEKVLLNWMGKFCPKSSHCIFINKLLKCNTLSLDTTQSCELFICLTIKICTSLLFGIWSVHTVIYSVTIFSGTRLQTIVERLTLILNVDTKYWWGQKLGMIERGWTY